MIELLKISHSYDNIKIINDLSLNIQDEGITVISGANGSGKTTLLKIISKILNPDVGIVKIPNEYFYRKRIGFVFQKPILLKRNVYENLSFILKKDNLASSSIKKIINKYLVKFFNNKDFDNFLKKIFLNYPGENSKLFH